MSFHDSWHAKARKQQRGISEYDAELIVEYASVLCKKGTQHQVVLAKDLDVMAASIGVNRKSVEHLLGAGAKIVEGNKVVTFGREWNYRDIRKATDGRKTKTRRYGDEVIERTSR